MAFHFHPVNHALVAFAGRHRCGGTRFLGVRPLKLCFLPATCSNRTKLLKQKYIVEVLRGPHNHAEARMNGSGQRLGEWSYHGKACRCDDNEFFLDDLKADFCNFL